MNDRTLEHAQHLLRHIHDPLALEENPLVAALGAGEVRQMLERLCAAMASDACHHARDSSIVRQCEIFRRCDLGSEPHSAVASDLGISRRQFYRERRIIARRVADLFAPLMLERGSYDCMAEHELVTLLHRLPDVGSPADLQVCLQRIALETRYSEYLHETGRDGESRSVDAGIRRRLAGFPRTGTALTLVQHAGIRLARRELQRGNVRIAMADLDVLADSPSEFDEMEEPA